MYIEALTKGAQVGDPSTWMLTGSSLPAQLNTEGAGAPTFTKEEALNQVYRLGSFLPVWGTVAGGVSEGSELIMADFVSSVGDNVGLFYTPSAVRQFEQYASFARSIKLEGDPDPACEAQLRQKQKAFDDASDAWNQIFVDAQDAFNDQTIYKTWEKFLKATPWGRQLSSADDLVRTTQNAFTQQYTECYGSDALNLNRALDKIREVEKALSGVGDSTYAMTVEDDTGKFVVPRYSPSPLGAAGYSGWLETAIANTGKLDPEVVITVDQTAQRYDYDQSKFSFNGSVRYDPFVWVDASGSYEEVKIDTASSEFSIEIKIQSVTQVTFDPGLWYEGSWLTGYSQPADHFDDSPFAKKPAWGPNGLFNTQARSAVIAFRPEVTATFDASSYKLMRKEWEADATLKIGIGPFYLGVGGGASGTKEDIEWDEQQQSFSFTDNTLIPKILALQVVTPNWPPA